ncbi:MAG: cytochrome c/FTR1 family iron permease [Gammaproteobacteria bacterium]|nr:cytochrome c/FTR1 family iron permease [Gammaproteobacteria bacterium]
MKLTRYLAWIMAATSLMVGAAVAAPGATKQQAIVESIIHSLDYVAVDYPGSVQQGKVISPSEYGEQLEMVDHAVERLHELEGSGVLLSKAQALQQAVHDKQDGNSVAAQCQQVIADLISRFQVIVAPAALPDWRAVSGIFEQQCASCHGAEGRGDGARAAGMEPPPIDFHHRGRQQHRNIYSLYNTITLGVDGTAMAAYPQLTTQQRWALAFYVSQYYASDSERAAGRQLWLDGVGRGEFMSHTQLVQAAPAQVTAQYGEDTAKVLAYLRAEPQTVQGQSPLELSRSKLIASMNEYRAGDSAAAFELALSAYLEGFELVETRLNASAPELRNQIEHEMIAYRNMIKSRLPAATLQMQQDLLLMLLSTATRTLNAERAASPSVNFISALAILLREGLEAILVIAAIISLLIKEGRRDAIRYIHVGWGVALALGVATWYLAERYVVLGGANRELTEGLTALLAAAMLLYVGFWLHNHSHSAQWRKFIHSKVSTSLGAGALSGLALVSFMAVYREMFESILFYQSLWMNAGEQDHKYIIGGIVVAAGLLLALGWMVMRLSVRLPLQSFFRVNMILMFVLAVIFTGKGIVALQETGLVAITQVRFIQIDMLGVYPNLQSLGAQLLITALVLGWAIYQYRHKGRRT